MTLQSKAAVALVIALLAALPALLYASIAGIHTAPQPEARARWVEVRIPPGLHYEVNPASDALWKATEQAIKAALGR
jgi:hypothetical protein